MTEQLQAQEALLDLTIVRFEPLTPGNGQNKGEKKEKLANAIKERLSEKDLEGIRHRLAGKLVAIQVVFLLWKGSPSKTNTRPVKDLDNLLKIVFDVLRHGPQGLGIIDEDSYIGEVFANQRTGCQGRRGGVQDYHRRTSRPRNATDPQTILRENTGIALSSLRSVFILTPS